MAERTVPLAKSAFWISRGPVRQPPGECQMLLGKRVSTENEIDYIEHSIAIAHTCRSDNSRTIDRVAASDGYPPYLVADIEVKCWCWLFRSLFHVSEVTF